MSRVIVSGGNGRFSNVMKKFNSSHEIFFLSKEEMNICDLNSIEKSILRYNPDVFIHTAALSRPMNLHDNFPEKSIELNIIGTSNCVVSCIKHNIKFIYISTDFVYPGETGNYKETDGVLPFNKYAWSKLGGECACMLYDNSLVLRMSMIENPFPHKKAFSDSFRSNIWHEEAVEILYSLIESDAKGIYNVGGEKKSVYDFVSADLNSIEKDTIKNYSEKIPKDISLNIDKLGKNIKVFNEHM